MSCVGGGVRDGLEDQLWPRLPAPQLPRCEQVPHFPDLSALTHPNTPASQGRVDLAAVLPGVPPRGSLSQDRGSPRPSSSVSR